MPIDKTSASCLGPTWQTGFNESSIMHGLMQKGTPDAALLMQLDASGMDQMMAECGSQHQNQQAKGGYTCT